MEIFLKLGAGLSIALSRPTLYPTPIIYKINFYFTNFNIRIIIKYFFNKISYKKILIQLFIKHIYFNVIINFKSNLFKKNSKNSKKKLNKTWQRRVWEFPIPCPILFNFLNGTGKWIILNKRGGIGMRATRLEPAQMSSLLPLSILYIWSNMKFSKWCSTISANYTKNTHL